MFRCFVFVLFFVRFLDKDASNCYTEMVGNRNVRFGSGQEEQKQKKKGVTGFSGLANWLTVSATFGRTWSQGGYVVAIVMSHGSVHGWIGCQRWKRTFAIEFFFWFFCFFLGSFEVKSANRKRKKIQQNYEKKKHNGGEKEK